VQRLKATTSGGHSPIVELAVAELLSQPGLEAGLRALRQRVAQRVDEARELIAASFPAGTRATDPPGGFILWVELPVEVDSMRLCEACLDERIVVAPGMRFSAGERYRHCIRLDVGGAWDAGAQRALRRVGDIATDLARRAAGVPSAPAFHLGMLP
jgi:DNA-binding transcriptional MocR family regulator